MKTVLLKISGELFSPTPSHDGNHDASHDAGIDVPFVHQIVSQIKQLTTTHHLSIVIGGGNFFRGSKEGRTLGMRGSTADTVGMLATVMNSLILRDFFHAQAIPCTILGAQAISGVIDAISQTTLDRARATGTVIIFAGGTGCPYFSTDTAGVVRALQMGAQQVWKATKVDYVYDMDPEKNPQAKPLKKLTYQEAHDQNLKVMDATAFTLAREHGIVLRVFSIFIPDALLKVAHDADFGSTISN